MAVLRRAPPDVRMEGAQEAAAVAVHTRDRFASFGREGGGRDEQEVTRADMQSRDETDNTLVREHRHKTDCAWRSRAARPLARLPVAVVA